MGQYGTFIDKFVSDRYTPPVREGNARERAAGALTGLDVAGLSVERGGRRVLRDLHFTLRSGDCLAVTGANGAGKSTLLRAIAGLLPGTAGTIRSRPADTDLVENLHYLGPSDALKPTLTLAENLLGWQAVLRGRAQTQGIAAVLDRLGLAALVHVPAAYLSAGQRRRLALARLLAAPRPLWLLDEPLNALDATAQATLDLLLGEHLAAGGLAIVATHAPLPRATKLLALAA